jgi:hypothetical protein
VTVVESENEEIEAEVKKPKAASKVVQSLEMSDFECEETTVT